MNFEKLTLRENAMRSYRLTLITCLIISVFIFTSRVAAQTTTFKSGSAIIDMGSASPTVQNSLKPYGLVYALLKNNRVPVSYVVNTSKSRDGIDFVSNGKSYKGGTFIISADYINTDVTSVLTNWANQGVLIDFTTSSLTLTVNYTINFIPKWVMDRTNGSIGVGFLTAAGIPASAYSFKNPAQLATCDDIFILPHADPVWSTHSNLLDWNRNFKGAIWAGCHAVSVLENLIDPNDATRKTNFLSTTGLVPFTDHGSTVIPFTSLLPGDPVGQYIGKTDNAQIGGSETVYLPKAGGAWNAGTKILTSSPLQGDVPALSPGVAVENIYGRAFDDNTRGYVAYQASHNIGGSSSDQIAAQRVFFNFSLFALRDKIPPIINISLSGQPSELRAGSSASLTANNSGSATISSYQWTVSPASAGSFGTPTAATTSFTPSSVTSATTCIITCVATEACGRVSFDSKPIPVIPQNPPITAANIIKSVPDGCTAASITFNVFDSNVNSDAGTRTLLSVTGLGGGTVITTTTGDITFTATANIKGVTTGTYTIVNASAVTASGSISITVGTGTSAPSISNDNVTAIANSLTVINVLGNDKDSVTATGARLYIRDITRKPSQGYVYINNDGTLSYLSKNLPTTARGDSFDYLACNTLGYCSVGTVNVTLIDNCGTGKYQSNPTQVPLTTTLTISRDSYIDAANTTTNFGNATTVQLRGDGGTTTTRALMAFTINTTLLTTTAVISQAILSLTVAADYTNPSGSFPLGIDRLLKTWTEGDGTAGSGVTWTKTDGTTSWTSNGANNTASLTSPDITLTNEVTMSYLASTTVLSNTVQTADIKNIAQIWVTTPASNFGVLIKPKTLSGSNTSLPTYFSKNNSDPTKAPQVLVSYYPCLTTPINYIPVVYPDASATTSALSVTISPLTNDVNYYTVANGYTAHANTLSSVTVPANGTATISGNNIIYTPNGTFVGVDTLTYTAVDGTNSFTNTSTVRVTVSRVAPTIGNDVTSVVSNSSITITVDNNDSDPQTPGTLTNPVIVTAPSNGTAVVVGTNVIYTPATNFTGTDNFTYRRFGAAADACTTALSSTASVTITVTNQTPVAVNDFTSTFACAPVSINLTSNDNDPEKGALTVAIISTTTSGTLTRTGEGVYKYTPNSGFTGVDNFTYTVTDPLNATSVAATCAITVSSAQNPNTAPIAVADRDSTLIGQPVYTNVLANDSDPNKDPLTISVTALGLTAPMSGSSVTVMPNKLIRYTPASGFIGTDTYQYQVSDSHPICGGNSSLTAVATVTITVKALPTTLSGTVYNDVDVSGQPDFSLIKTNTETGTNGNGSIYVYVVDNANIIKDRTPVDVDGTYTLSSVPSLTSNLKLILSNEDLGIGNTMTTGSLPAGYNFSSPLSRTLPTTLSTDMGGYDWGIYVNPVLTGGIIAGSASFCGTSTIPASLTTTANATGGSLTSTRYKYQWQSSVVSATTGFSDLSAADSLTTYSPGTISTTTFFRRSVVTKDRSNNNINAAVFSNAVTITQNPNPTVNITPSTGTVNINASLSVTAGGAGTYSWSPATSLSATNTATVTAGPLTATTAYVATGTITATGCSSTATITITVINPGVIGTDQSNCGSFTPTTLSSASDATGAAGITYQWQSSTVSDFSSSVTTITGATSTTYSPGITTATTYYRRVAISGGSSFNSNIVTVTVKSIPAVTAGGGPVCTGSVLNLTSTSGHAGYSWSGPNGFTSSSQNPTIPTTTSSAGGTYTVQVTGSNGCTNTASTTVTVNTLPTVTITPSTGTININSSLSVTAGGGGTYSWSPSTNLSAINTATVTAGPLTATTAYVATGTITATGCSSTATITITVINPGVIGTDQSNCGTFTPNTLTSASDAGGASGITYQWQSSTVSDFRSSVITITGAISTTYSPGITTATTYYRRVAISGGASFNSNIVTVTVKSIPAVTAGGGPVCTGSALNLTSTSGHTGYSWSGPNGFTSSSQNPTIQTTTSSAGGTYTVQVTGTNGCTNTSTTSVTVIALPTLTVIPSNVSYVSGSSQVLTAGGASTYAWSPSTGLSSTSGISVTTSVTNTTTYTVTGTSVDNCVNTTNVVVTVNPSSISPGTVGSDQTICTGSTPASFTSTTAATSGGAAITYQWQQSPDNINFADIASANSATYAPAALTQTAYYRRGANATGIPGTSYTGSLKITVQQSIPGSINGGNIPVCSDINSGTLTLTGQTGNIIKWQSSINNGGSFADISNTTASLSYQNLTATTQYQAVVQVGTCAIATTTGVSVTVLPKPNVTVTPAVADITIGGNVVLTAGGALSYSWSPVTALSATNTVSVIANPTSTVTYTVIGTTNGCTNTASSVVTVNAGFSPGTIGSDQTICSGSTPAQLASVSAASGGTGVITYQWQTSTDNVNFLNIPSTNTSTYSPGSLTQLTFYRRSASTASDAITYTGSIKITVQSTVSGTITSGGITTVCAGSNSGTLTLTDRTGSVLKWQSSVNGITFNDISNTTPTQDYLNITVSTAYRAVVQLNTCAIINSAAITVTVIPLPVAGPISGRCALPKDSAGIYTIASVPNATGYTWTLPTGWSGTSVTNNIKVTAGATNGTISVVAVNGTCSGPSVSFGVKIIDYARTNISATPVTASGNKNSSILITMQLVDINGNNINCSGGVGTLCTSSGEFSPVIDNNDGTYTAFLTSSANSPEICGTVAGIPILKKITVTFTGPQGGIKSNGPILATETPTITFTATAGREPFTVIYRSAKRNKNDTLTNVNNGKAVGVALIPSTTLYTLVSVIDASGERRDNNFIRDTTTTIVLTPKVIITLKADPAKLEKDSSWATRLVVRTKNIGNLDLTNSQAKLNLKDVFPSPVTYVLDSIRYTGTTIVANKSYDGVQSNDLFARLNKSNMGVPVSVTNQSDARPSGGQLNGIDGITDVTRAEMEIQTGGNSQAGDESQHPFAEYDDHSVYMFGPLSSLPVGVEAVIILYLHVRPNGYTEPFVMQAVALGTGSTAGATALTTSLSNDNNNVDVHPELTKIGDPLPTIINLFPSAVIGVSLSADAPVLQTNGSYNVLLTYRLKNYGNLNLQSVKLVHNLLRMIGSPAVFTVTGPVSATNELLPNTGYDGKLDSNILAANSVLAYKKESIVRLAINILPNQLRAIYRLQALATGFSEDLNSTVTDLSTDGSNPDPDNDNIPDEKIITVITINLPIAPLTPGSIGILINPAPRTTVPTKLYCSGVSGIVVVANSDATGGSSAFEYQWQSSGDNVSFLNIKNAVDSIYTTGILSNSIYLRRRVISDSQVVYTNSVYLQATTAVKPVITASGPLTLVPGGNVVLTSTQAGSYTWSNNATTRSITITTAGVGPYRVTIADANNCPAISDTVNVLPPPPVTINATYILGAINNPVNSGRQVTGFTGATLNYYILTAGGVFVPVPLLPTAVGVYTYYVSQTINGLESARIPYTVTMIDKVADLEKTLSKAPVLQADGSFVLTFTILSSNLRGELLDSVKIKDDLTKVFPLSTQYEVVGVKASGKLLSNSLYNGSTQIELLSDGSQLPPLQKDSVQVTLKVFSQGFSGTLNNSAEQVAKSPFGTFKVTSNDPTAGNGLTVRAPTKFIIPFIDIFIPSGFSPNRDGTNDLFVITRPYNTSISLDIFNRWGNIVYRSPAPDYRNDWNGKGNQPSNILGEDLPDGTYYYIVLATDRLTGSVRKFAGYITLKR